MSKWGKIFVNWLKVVLTKEKLLAGIFIATGTIIILYQFAWSGFGKDSNISVTTKQLINPKDGKIVTLKDTTIVDQSEKKLWDWLQLAGIVAIPIVIFQFQRNEQRQADANLREDTLKTYIDGMSELLLEKHLKTLTSDEPLRDIAWNVARAKTLSVLRRLDKDGERKGSVIRFLIDTELISELDLKIATLSDANLELANLENTFLELATLDGAKLRAANLANAQLGGASLNGADLSNANLSTADLRYANLTDAILTDANLTGAILSGAILSGAILTVTQLEQARLDEETKLPNGCKYKPDQALDKQL